MAPADTPPSPPDRDSPRPLASISCSFCGKRAPEVAKVIAGPTPAVAICNECVELCSQIIAEERAGELPPDSAA